MYSDSYTKLLMHFEDETNGTAFIDYATGKVFSRVSNPIISEAQFVFGKSSFGTTGTTGGNINTPSHTDFDFGTNDFTIDFWVRFATLGTTVLKRTMLWRDAAFNVVWNSTNALETFGQSFSWTPVINVWYHVAVIRNGMGTNNLTAYINGTSIGSGTYTDNYSSSNTFYIGAEGGTTNTLHAYIDELRISNGIARWTGNFTLPTRMYDLPYPYDTSTAFVIHCDGPQGWWNFIDDVKYRTITNSSPANIYVDQSQKAIVQSNGSAYFTGVSSDQLVISTTAAESFGSNPFTIECWVRFAALGGVIRGIVGNTTATKQIRHNGTSSLTVLGLTFTWTPSLNTWYHLAVVREGTGTNQFKVYINGALLGTGTYATALTSAEQWLFGSATTGASPFNGWMQEIRFSYVARYTTDFTPETTYDFGRQYPYRPAITTYDELVIPCNGPDGGATFVDAIGHTVSSASTSPDINIGSTSLADTSILLYIGCQRTAATSPINGFNGHMDEIRISNNARWTSDFTPDTSAYSSDANTMLLLHCDGTDGSNSFPDSSSSAHVMTAAGNIQVDTAFTKFGTGAALFDGNGDYLSTPDSTDWAFGSGDFTLEAWIRTPATLSTTMAGIIDLWSNSEATRSFKLAYRSTEIQFGYGNGTTSVTSTRPFDFQPLTWYHIAAVRTGSSVKIFVNGVQHPARVETQSAQKTFDRSSAEYSGLADNYIYCNNAADFVFGANDFTIDMWLMFRSVPASATNIISQVNPSSPTTDSWEITCTSTIFTVTVRVGSTTAVLTMTNPAYTIVAYRWMHIALVRYYNGWFFFIDGKFQRAAQASVTMPDFAGNIIVGERDNSTNLAFNGWIDEIHINNGEARWLYDFTPPMAPYAFAKQQALTASYDMRSTKEQSLLDYYGVAFPKRMLSFLSEYSMKLGQQQQLTSEYKNEWPTKAISLASSFDMRGTKEMQFQSEYRARTEIMSNLLSEYSVLLSRFMLSLKSDFSLRVPQSIAMKSNFSSRSFACQSLKEETKALSAKEVSLLTDNNARMAVLVDMLSSNQVRARVVNKLATAYQQRMVSQQALKDNFGVRLFAAISLLDNMRVVSRLAQGLSTNYNVRMVGMLGTGHGRYDMNTTSGYHVTATDTTTLVETYLGFVPYVKGVVPTIAGITLPAGTYDISFELQGYRWEGWQSANKFRVTVPAAGPVLTLQPQIHWSDVPYTFAPGRATIYWVWEELLGAYDAYRFLVWKSTTANPPTSTTPIYVRADFPHEYADLWLQSQLTYIAVASQYYDSDGYLLTGDPIYLTVPANPYVPPLAPIPQFAYDKAIEPVDTAFYPSGPILLSTIGTDPGEPVYDIDRDHLIYIV
jgi:hypothetical protein